MAIGTFVVVSLFLEARGKHKFSIVRKEFPIERKRKKKKETVSSIHLGRRKHGILKKLVSLSICLVDPEILDFSISDLRLCCTFPGVISFETTVRRWMLVFDNSLFETYFGFWVLYHLTITITHDDILQHNIKVEN